MYVHVGHSLWLLILYDTCFVRHLVLPNPGPIFGQAMLGKIFFQKKYKKAPTLQVLKPSERLVIQA